MSTPSHLSLEELAVLKETFRAQSLELLEDYSRYVLALESEADPSDLLKAIQRVVHTLKGDSMSLELDRLAQLAHRIEDFLDPLKKKSQSIHRREIDLLLQCGDAMTSLLESYCTEPPKPPMAIQSLCRRLDEAIEALAQSDGARPFRLTLTFHRKCQMHSAGAFLIRQRLQALGRVVESTPDPDTQDIERSRTWTLIVASNAEASELRKAARVAGVSSRVSVEAYRGPIARAAVEDDDAGTKPTPATAGSEGACPSTRTASGSDQLRMDVRKIDRIMNLVGELVIGRSMISQALKEVSASDEAAVSRLTAANHFLERTLTELQAVVLKIRMVPVDHVFRRFPRIVRDLAHSSGKSVRLQIQGASTELDKSIVDALYEPLLHLVRNAIDHGLESPEARSEAGKPGTGSIQLAAYYEGNHVHIVVEDDGRGIDTEHLRQRALSLGIARPGEIDALPSEEMLNVIFQPGFSTREQVSTVSGRGIGMDVVRKVIEELKGTIDVSTETGRGTRLLIRLPLTLAILKAILVESAGRVFAIPLSAVLEIVRLFPEEAETVLGKGVLRLRDRVVPLVELRRALHLEEDPTREARRGFVILSGEAERRLGLVVDRLLGEHELVVKPIADPLIRSPGIAGASILGDGKVVLILNLRGLTGRKARIHARASVP